MNALSVFDGISCGQVALQRAGIHVDNYFASEIDKYAIKVTMKNHPNTIQLGSVVNWREWNLPHIDLLIAGSPCQGFSKSGKGLNFDDPRSKLFFEFINIRKALQPDKWMLENVDMKKDWRDIISDYMGIQPVKINSALVSAQNRVRLYWANWNISKPRDKHIYLKDIIEDGKVDRKKSYTIDANYFKGGSLEDYLEKKRRQIVNLSASERRLCVRVGTASDVAGHDYQKRIYSDKGKNPTISAQSHLPKILIVPEATKKGYVEIFPNEGVDLSFPASATPRGRRMNKKANALQAGEQDFNWYNGENYRKLTVTECERLQTLEDGYTEGVSDTQRYKMLGNGWTVDVIAHIFSQMQSQGEIWHMARQSNLFAFVEA